jgi:hypothetical protein
VGVGRAVIADPSNQPDGMGNPDHPRPEPAPVGVATTGPTTAATGVESAIAAPPEFDAPTSPAPAPPAALRRSSQFERVVPEGGTWAVIIGINDYPGTRGDLGSAVNDANDVNEALRQAGVEGAHRLLIRDGQATQGVVLAAADWLVAHAGPDAVAVFFYAGHVRKVGGSTEAIVAADGRTVTDADLAQRFARLRAKQAWFAMASCYGAGFTELLGPGRVLTGAAAADQLAYENSGFGRSYMVQYMVREAWLERRAGPTVQAAFDYAKHAAVRDGHGGREPVQLQRGNDSLDLRPNRAANPAPAKPASPPTPPPAQGGGTGQPATPPDQCESLTLGVVSCG